MGAGRGDGRHARDVRSLLRLIITGAPLIDRVRTTGGFSNTLNGITIAVVGVIGGLGVFVARHALVADGHVRWVLSVLAAVAFVAVWRFRVGVIPVIAACALVGVMEALLT